MNARQMKIWLKNELEQADRMSAKEWSFDADDGFPDLLVQYLGSYMYLDPCGRYHHILSPNGATARCEAFWERLEHVANEIGAWIESGEGDPTDIFLVAEAK